ncbi:ATP-binding protein [Reyranella sp.]|uniref:ATP-binding protein n=1 Tax=Reyranella sp. TaxID=1929291 RepID=UPI003D097243
MSFLTMPWSVPRGRHTGKDAVNSASRQTDPLPDRSDGCASSVLTAQSCRARQCSARAARRCQERRRERMLRRRDTHGRRGLAGDRAREGASTGEAVAAGAARRDGSQARHGAAERSYAFGEFCLLPDRQALLHAGQPVRIGSRALDILSLLVQRAGELVSRSELEAYAWPGTFVHESNLKVHVSALRRVLRAGSDEPGVILNIPGRGYRFTLPVTVEGRARASSRRWPGADMETAAPRARIIGREDEIASVVAAISQHPLVTIVGAGGVGKTTVALAAAERLSGRFDAAPCFVDLSSIDDPQLVAHAIAGALGVRVDLNDLLGGIGEHLRATPRLLILDNCEHLASAVAAAAEHLAPDLDRTALLATSREPLRARQEHVYRLSPLACPDGATRMPAAEAQRYPAVALFVARAEEGASSFAWDDDTAAAVSRICSALDGIPLAIELAATRLDSLSPAELLRRLQDRFELLRRADLAAPARQRTLLATLDWSYRLLSDAESRILRFAALFARDFALDDLIALLASAGPDAAPLDTADIVAGIEGLVAKSFATAELSRGSRRYRLFESSRSYALARLDAGGERDRAHVLHATRILTVLERAEEEWHWRVTDDWMALYGARVDDLRRALAWAFGATGDSMLGVRLTAAAIPLWEALCHVDESGARVGEALRVADTLASCDARLKTKLACRHAWTLTWSEQRLPATEAPWIDCLRLARDSGDTEYQLRALWGLAIYETFTARSVAAIGHLIEFEAMAERAEDWSVLPDGQRLLALARTYVGELREGNELLEQLAKRFNRVEKRARITRFSIDRYCIIRSSLAFTRWLCGRTESALAAAAQAVDAALAVDHAVSHSNALAFAGVPLALWTGNLDRAEAGIGALRENLAIRNTAVWRRLARFFEAALHQARGDRTAIEPMSASLDELLDTGFVTRAPMYLAMLAEALVREGRVADARLRIDDAATRIAQSRERWCRPEILRIQGLIRAADGDHAAAQARYAEAIADAGALGALNLELRAASDMARDLAAEGRRDAAFAILSRTCAKFTEKGPNSEIVAAQALLDTLA